MEKRPPKPLEWVGSSLDDLSAFPAEVKRKVGFALRAAQNGEKSPDASPMTGFGGEGVLEIVEDFDGNTYRAVYTVKFTGVVYVLHAFQKKSKHGIKTPKHEIEVISAVSRWRGACTNSATSTRKEPEMDDTRVIPSSGNVFADLGLPDSAELLAKADLAIEIGRVLDERGLSQAEAARMLRTSQPRISDLRRGKLEGFTIDRLLRFLNALDQDVELTIHPKRSSEARLVVTGRAA